MKNCNKCISNKDLEDFPKNSSYSDGRTNTCKLCTNERLRVWNENNPEKQILASKKYLDKNREACQVRCREYKLLNKDNMEVKAKQWRSSNRGWFTAATAQRNAIKKKATVSWSNQGAISTIYAKCARLSIWLGVPHQVDHIVPLQSNFVCGLHCEDNLRITTATENFRKGNRYWPDMP